MSASELYVGVDGGGSSTRAVIVDAWGRILGRGVAGSGNHDDVGAEGVQASLRQAIEQAAAQAGVALHFAALHCGLAGVRSLEDEAVVRRAVLTLDCTRQVGVSDDLVTALHGGTLGKPGVVLVAGTGSAAYGLSAQGEGCWVGGWGHLLGDEGSGFALALEALKAALRCADGRLGFTQLLSAAQDFLELNDIKQIMHRVYVGGISRRELAAFAPVVLRVAQEDEIAADIVRRGAAELAQLVHIAALRLHLERCAVITVGSLLSHPHYRELVSRELATHSPSLTLRMPLLPPEVGAALLAIRQAGRPTAPHTLIRLRQEYARLYS